MSKRRRNRKDSSKQRTGSSRGAGGPAPPRRRLSRAKIRRRIQHGAGAVIAVAVIAGLWWIANADHREFLALADGGRDALPAQVTSELSAGRDHVSGNIDYDHRFPTSGPHNPTWVEPGVYERRQPKEKLVHALEHGNIVIYYDEPEAAVMERLRDWAGLYDNQWSGIVVTPAPGLGESLVLTAWTKRLRLDDFQPAVAAAFIDAYRGRGPENPVR